jgi:Methyltransferase domain
MSPLFQKLEAGKKPSAKRGSTAKVPRHSSGWSKVLARLKAEPGLRVLDIGPTSPNNINFLTNLGHSVYMADLVEEAVKPEWMLPAVEGEAQGYDAERFLARHMDFGDRKFDVVLLWDALDYIPPSLGDAILDRLTAVLADPGMALAFFHSRSTGPETTFCRYHIGDGDVIHTQEGPDHPILRTYQNRQIEALLQNIGSCRFLLAKDNTREVIVSR